MDFVLPFVLLFGMTALYFTFQLVKNRGLKGALFGKPVAETVGELDLGARRRVRMTLKVHVLRSDDDTRADIGIELTSKTFGGYSMVPISMTIEQGRALSMMLSHAATRAQGLGPTN